MRYGSVCSGIEAASVAWHCLGWQPAWFAEIEKFPSAVLAHHWPHVQNLGDMTRLAAGILAGEIEAPDLLVGGTPCQAFSVAGLRNGLADARGQLTLAFVELVNAIDKKRRECGKSPVIVVWENVPGVFTSKDNAFGCFIAGLAGEGRPLEVAGGKWTHAGYVVGSERAVAWRTLDAQFFRVAQRRRRVFVIASARDDLDPAKVFFEPESLRRNTPPRRKTGTAVAPLTAAGVGVSGPDFAHAAAGHLISAFGGGNCSGSLDVAACLSTRCQRQDFDVETFLVQFSSTGQGAWAEGAGTLRAREQESHEHLAMMSYGLTTEQTPKSGEELALTLTTGSPSGGGQPQCVAYVVHGTQDPDTNTELAHTIGRNQGHESAILAYGFQQRIARNGRGDMGDLCHTLSAEAGETGKGDSAPCVAVAYPLLEVGKRTGSSTTDPRAGLGIGSDGDPMFTLQAGAQHGVAFAENSRGEIRFQDGDGEITGPLSTGGGKPGQGYPAVVVNMAVRRLTPRECERLQGFPDGYTQIPWRKKTAEQCPDGPRYRAIGNSMAVPVMRWIGERIARGLVNA